MLNDKKEIRIYPTADFSDIKNAIEEMNSRVDDSIKRMEKFNTVYSFISNSLSLLKSWDSAANAINMFANTMSAGAAGSKVFDAAVQAQSNTVMKVADQMSSAVNMQSLFNTAIAAFSSPSGMMIGALAALGTGVAILTSLSTDHLEEERKSIAATQEKIDAFNDLKAQQSEAINGDIAQIDRTQSLSNELRSLTDVNGKVKDGYQDRASFILGELNNALGTEYTMNDNVIQEYGTMCSSIDTLIAKKRAQIIVESEEEGYAEALKNKTEALTLLSQKESEYSATKIKNDAQIKKLQEDMQVAGDYQKKSIQDQINKLNEETEVKKTNYETQLALVGNYNETIMQYEADQTALLSGNEEQIEEINNRKSASYVSNGEVVQLSLQQQLENELSNLESLKAKREECRDYEDEKTRAYNEKLYDEQIANSEASLEAMMGSNENELSQYDTFIAEKITKADELRIGLQNNAAGITQDDVIAAETQKAQALNAYGQYVNEKMDRAIYLRTHMNDANSGITQDMVTEAENQATQAAEKYKNVAEKVTENWDTLEPDTKKAFEEMMKPMMTEMEGKKQSLWDKANEIASGIISTLRAAFDEHSPSKETKKIFKFLMKGAELGLEEEAPGLIKKTEDFADNVLSNLQSLNDFEMSDFIKKANAAVEKEHAKVYKNIQADVETKLMKDSFLMRGNCAVFPSLAYKDKQKTAQISVNIDGREAANILAPYMDEELGFLR